MEALSQPQASSGASAEPEARKQREGAHDIYVWCELFLLMIWALHWTITCEYLRGRMDLWQSNRVQRDCHSLTDVLRLMLLQPGHPSNGWMLMSPYKMISPCKASSSVDCMHGRLSPGLMQPQLVLNSIV